MGFQFSPWVVPGALRVLRSSSFSLGSLRCFGIFSVRVWSVSCWGGQLGLRILFFSCPTDPPSQCWARGGPFLFVRLFFFRPADPPTQYSAMVRVIGPLNRGKGLQVFRVRFFCRPADALLSSEPGGGQGNLATPTVAQDCICCLLFSVMQVVLFSILIGVFG